MNLIEMLKQPRGKERLTQALLDRTPPVLLQELSMMAETRSDQLQQWVDNLDRPLMLGDYHMIVNYVDEKIFNLLTPHELPKMNAKFPVYTEARKATVEGPVMEPHYDQIPKDPYYLGHVKTVIETVNPMAETVVYFQDVEEEVVLKHVSFFNGSEQVETRRRLVSGEWRTNEGTRPHFGWAMKLSTWSEGDDDEVWELCERTSLSRDDAKEMVVEALSVQHPPLPYSGYLRSNDFIFQVFAREHYVDINVMLNGEDTWGRLYPLPTGYSLFIDHPMVEILFGMMGLNEDSEKCWLYGNPVSTRCLWECRLFRMFVPSIPAQYSLIDGICPEEYRTRAWRVVGWDTIKDDPSWAFRSSFPEAYYLVHWIGLSQTLWKVDKRMFQFVPHGSMLLLGKVPAGHVPLTVVLQVMKMFGWEHQCFEALDVGIKDNWIMQRYIPEAYHCTLVHEGARHVVYPLGLVNGIREYQTLGSERVIGVPSMHFYTPDVSQIDLCWVSKMPYAQEWFHTYRQLLLKLAQDGLYPDIIGRIVAQVGKGDPRVIYPRGVTAHTSLPIRPFVYRLALGDLVPMKVHMKSYLSWASIEKRVALAKEFGVHHAEVTRTWEHLSIYRPYPDEEDETSEDIVMEDVG